ncbi:MAG: alpha/beta hydrolase [Actinomycetia bacterium]|nr:alpha/beta hydrolase [Actinomycetes bacterium]MCP4962647.1 alpha/beta hydrolase [Actinomycetes bacterium]
MPVANVNGQAIRYDDTGGSGPVVLFSHGFLMDRTMFEAQVESLGGAYRCVTWDERGFGETAATEPFDYWDSARDALGLLDHLEVDSAVFVGMSQGGFLSLRAALLEPQRVMGLVLIDSQAGVDDAETLAGYEGMIAHWTSGEPLGEVGQFVAGLIIGEPTLATTWIEKWEARDRATVVHPARALLERDDITDRLGEIDCPVLSIHGEEDQAISMDRAELVQDSVKHPRGLVRVPGAAHAPNMTHPEIVNPALGSFLASLC